MQQQPQRVSRPASAGPSFRGSRPGSGQRRRKQRPSSAHAALGRGRQAPPGRLLGEIQEDQVTPRSSVDAGPKAVGSGGAVVEQEESGSWVWSEHGSPPGAPGERGVTALLKGGKGPRKPATDVCLLFAR